MGDTIDKLVLECEQMVVWITFELLCRIFFPTNVSLSGVVVLCVRVFMLRYSQFHILQLHHKHLFLFSKPLAMMSQKSVPQLHF
jgi:hypothetical protein